MIRESVRFEVIHGQYPDAIEICREIDQQCQAKGLTTAHLRVPLAGKSNVIHCETEYESLAEYDRQSKLFYTDPDLMKNVRRLGAVTVQSSMFVELTDDLEDFA